MSAKTSRAELFESDGFSSDNEPLNYGNIDLEFIEVEEPNATEVDIPNSRAGKDESEKLMEIEQEQKEQKEQKEQEEQEEQEEEFDFPLFASSVVADNPKEETEGDERGRSNVRIMKVSLREASEERIIQERPSSYYFASYTSSDKLQFEKCAISFEEIWQQAQMPNIDMQPWKVINLKQHNDKIEAWAQREAEVKRKQRTRAGKKHREQKIKIKQKIEERKRVEAQLEKIKHEKLMKKKFHKRGGKKHKKNSGTKDSKVEKPKYRTE